LSDIGADGANGALLRWVRDGESQLPPMLWVSRMESNALRRLDLRGLLRWPDDMDVNNLLR